MAEYHKMPFKERDEWRHANRAEYEAMLAVARAYMTTRATTGMRLAVST